MSQSPTLSIDPELIMEPGIIQKTKTRIITPEERNRPDSYLLTPPLTQPKGNDKPTVSPSYNQIISKSNVSVVLKAFSDHQDSTNTTTHRFQSFKLSPAEYESLLREVSSKEDLKRYHDCKIQLVIP